MGKVTSVISDESVNEYGNVILTEGIDTSQFERNPVMFYMHERRNVIGRWENVRKENKKLLADAVFDDSTPLGLQVKNQVEKGFLRSASGNFQIINRDVINGVDTITECSLLEVSIVDIPGNNNALKLYRKNGCDYLCLVNDENVENLRASIIEILGLDPDVSDGVILSEIETLKNSIDDTASRVNDAITKGFIDDKSRKDLENMARNSPRAFESFIRIEENNRKKTVLNLIDKAIADKRISFAQKELYSLVGEKCGFYTLDKLLASTPIQLKLSSLIGRDKYEGWTLADFRHYAPEVIKNNPGLYRKLLERECEPKHEGRTLDWFRKNAPEYLKEHPEVYKKLLENK